MSSFDEWYDQATFQGKALFLFVDRMLAKCLYNAGMERAAEIADEAHLECDKRHCTNQDAAELIRKEIEK